MTHSTLRTSAIALTIFMALAAHTTADLMALRTVHAQPRPLGYVVLAKWHHRGG